MIDYTRLSKLKMLEKFLFIFFSFLVFLISENFVFGYQEVSIDSKTQFFMPIESRFCAFIFLTKRRNKASRKTKSRKAPKKKKRK